MENLYLILAGGLGTFAIIFILMKSGSKKPVADVSSPSRVGNADDVGKFYDEQTDNFLKVYGEVIQAFRTRDLSNLLEYQIEAMGLSSGQYVLDAGCGVCGPAIYFAKSAGVKVEALTISEEQRKLSQQKIEEAGLSNEIFVRRGDYHQMSSLYEKGKFDVVYFLESFGHSHDKEKVIAEAFQLLKPGGTLYIKDLFLKEPIVAAHEPRMKQEVERINDAYHYHIGDLYAVLKSIRKSGFILSALKTIDLPLVDFENLTISNDFQELTGIGKIDNWKEYIFPVDFFELKCVKPTHDIGVGNSRYFLQNMYYMQVLGKSESELNQTMEESSDRA